MRVDKRFTYVIDNGKDTIYDLNHKGEILENFIDIEEMLNNLHEENEELKQQIKSLRLNVFESIREADEMQCSCNPCVVEECVMRVVR